MPVKTMRFVYVTYIFKRTTMGHSNKAFYCQFCPTMTLDKIVSVYESDVPFDIITSIHIKLEKDIHITVENI